MGPSTLYRKFPATN
ncbi:TPA: hypothetical protein ACS53I_004474 [Salmonella enterica]